MLGTSGTAAGREGSGDRERSFPELLSRARKEQAGKAEKEGTRWERVVRTRGLVAAVAGAVVWFR